MEGIYVSVWMAPEYAICMMASSARQCRRVVNLWSQGTVGLQCGVSGGILVVPPVLKAAVTLFWTLHRVYYTRGRSHCTGKKD
ncbi:hypothetical protein BJX63DRAFT_388861 [Aspergillus granulosus]|uniref:Uncharacterized protein n=1 Tax=Aspergillus granulosus TaxID=176169 RepID=A0ABR4HKB2_9EURO